MTNRPALLLAIILLIMCGVFYFLGNFGALVMPLLIAGVIALVIAVATGK